MGRSAPHPGPGRACNDEFSDTPAGFRRRQAGFHSARACPPTAGSAAREYRDRREVPAIPWQGVAKRIAGLARAYRGPLSMPRRCALSAVTQRCGSASPGLNRVFCLLPQRLEVLLDQWPRRRRICQVLDVSGVVSTAPPATVLNRSGMPRSVLPGESGGCSTRVSCGRDSSRRPGYPTDRAAGQIRESRGERPCSLGRPFRSKSGGHRRLPECGVRDTGRRS